MTTVVSRQPSGCPAPMQLTALQRRMCPPQLSQTGEVCFQSGILLPPGVDAAVKGIFPALHADFVTIIDGGDAGEGKQHQRRQTHPLQTQLPPGRGEAAPGARGMS